MSEPKEGGSDYVVSMVRTWRFPDRGDSTSQCLQSIVVHIG